MAPQNQQDGVSFDEPEFEARLKAGKSDEQLRKRGGGGEKKQTGCWRRPFFCG
jgi:hypothetical protein